MVERDFYTPSKHKVASELYAKASEFKQKYPFMEAMSQTFPLKIDSELDLAVGVTARMDNTTFEEKWHTLMGWMWFEKTKLCYKVGLAEKDVGKSVDAIGESKFLHFMYNTVASIVDARRTKRNVELPNRYRVRVMYRDALIEEYLQVLEDGKQLPYKQIAQLVSQELEEPISIKYLIHYISSLVTVKGKHARRLLSKEDVMEMSEKIKKLRQETEGLPKSRRAIAAQLGQKARSVNNIITKLINSGEIERRQQENFGPILSKIFLEYSRRYPGRAINLSAIARELGIRRKTVEHHYHNYVTTATETPPVSANSWKTAEQIVYLDLVKEVKPET